MEAYQYRILHLASHVSFDELRPLYSLIALSRDASNGDSKGLRAIDFLSLDLNADLVVLSGCNTGRLSSRSGSDGLTSSIMISGVPTVVASLWNVDDEVTANLMEAFYGNLKKGNTKSEALRRAKMELVHSGKSDPFYWGAFVLCGDGGRISLDDTDNKSSKTFSETTAVLCLSSACLVMIIAYWRHRQSS